MKACNCVIFWSSTLRRASYKPGVKIASRDRLPADATQYEHRVDGQDWRLSEICDLQDRIIQRGVNRDAAHVEFMRIDEYRAVMQEPISPTEP